MSVRFTLLALAIVAASSAAPALADEPILFRHRMEKGRPLIYRTEMVTDQVQTFSGQKVETQIRHADIALRTLESIDDDGNLRIKTENKRLETKLKIGPLGEYRFDSASTERDKGNELSEALNPLYERLSGAVLTVRLSPMGEVAEVEGYEMLVGDLLKDSPIAQQFSGGGTRQAARLSFQDAFVQFGKDPVKPGESWEVPFDLDVPKLGKVQGKRIYTYEAADKVGERSTARIGVAVELAFDLNIDVNGAKVAGKLASQNATGTVQFDPARGEIVSKTTKFTIAGDLTVEVNGNVIPLRTEQTQSITSELLDKLPE